MEIHTYEVFTKEYSKIIQSATIAGAISSFWREVPINEDPIIIAVIDVVYGQEFISEKNP